MPTPALQQTDYEISDQLVCRVGDRKALIAKAQSMDLQLNPFSIDPIAVPAIFHTLAVSELELLDIDNMAPWEVDDEVFALDAEIRYARELLRSWTDSENNVCIFDRLYNFIWSDGDGGEDGGGRSFDRSIFGA